MKLKFEKQVREISELPEHIKQQYGLDTLWLTQQNKTIKNLADCLQEELNNLDFDLFDNIMGNEEYDTEIHYDGHSIFERDMSWSKLGKQYSWKEPIESLKNLFESNRSIEEKKKIEAIIIFGIFLQATWDFYEQLRLYPETRLYRQENEREHASLLPDGATCRAFINYLWLLDNLSYKCNPTAYKLLSALNYTALWLLLSSIIIVPVTVTLIMFSPPSILAITSIVIAGMIVACFVCPMWLSIRPMLPISKEENSIDERWGKNWAYRMPDYATSQLDYGAGKPTAIGIFPSISGYPSIPAGLSFKAMNRFGFFPFRETANQAIEMAERVLENTTGKTSAALPY